MAPTTEGMNEDLKERIFKLIAASHGKLYLTSGYRDSAQQANLYHQAVQKYGEADAGNWAAPPGHSNHEKGLAADIGGDLGVLAQLAPQFGLVTPMSWEPWHVEMVGTRDTASPHAYTTPPAGQTNPVDDQTLGSTPQYLAASLSDALSGKLMSSALGPAGQATLGSPSLTGGTGTQASGAEPAGGGGASTAATTPGTTPHATYAPESAAGGDPRLPGHTLDEWITGMITKLGVPDTPGNRSFFQTWANTESGGYNPNAPGGRYNPLNTTEGALGYAGQGGSQGDIKDYASFQQGLDAQAYNLMHTQGAGYEQILAALHDNNQAAAFQAVNASHFGTHFS